MPVQISRTSGPADSSRTAANKAATKSGWRINPIVAIALGAIAVLLLGFSLWKSFGSSSAQMDSATVQQHIDAKRAKLTGAGVPAPGAGAPAGASLAAGERPGRMLK